MLSLYRWATIMLGPVARMFLRRRASRGKEDLTRLEERFGWASIPRPQGHLVWVHAASVGESLSVLPLVVRMLEVLPRAHILFTTGTLTSARLLKDRLPDQAFHQFVPIDHPVSVRRFLDYWLPDMAIWVESELWPNLLRETHLRNISTVLVQGRMSRKSYLHWRRVRNLIAPVLKGFDRILVQTREDAVRFQNLGAVSPVITGSLKYASSLLRVDEEQLRSLEHAVGSRPLWLAASIHPGEFELVCQAHLRLRPRFSDLLTIVVPRHPSSVKELVGCLKSYDLKFSQRSTGGQPSRDTDVYVADTMGELGLFYRLSRQALIGGSFIEHGGQNPLEAIQLNCAVITGPSMFNFAEVVADFISCDASFSMASLEEVVERLAVLLATPELAIVLAEKQKSILSMKAGVLDLVFGSVSDFLPATE